MILACQNISKSYGIDNILQGISFHIEDKEKIAIVGINGAGKSTLLKIIMGYLNQDEGQVVLAKDATIGYLSQHQDISFDNTVYEEMLNTKKHLVDLENKIRLLETEMALVTGDELEHLLEHYNRLFTKFERENGYALESQITGVLKGLGFDKSDYTRHINTLSGGQKMRIALGRLLLTNPDIIILDEPTNHLDMNSISWLEGYLSSYQGAVIIVSHDRYFMDKIITKVIELDNHKSSIYHGNYSYYSQKRNEVRATLIKAFVNQQKELKHQQDVITKLKSFNREKSIKRAESREKMLNKIEVLEKPKETINEMRILLEPSVLSGEDVLTVEGLSKSFGNNLLFDDLNFEIKRGEHIALIGGNGTGKSTILKLINKFISKDSGIISLGSRVKIGYYDQEHQVLSLNKTIFEEISDSYPSLTNTKIRNVLAAFLFTTDDVFKKISDLSGGERGRVSLAKLMLSPANFLILDEPTNHLDIQSKEILENALKNYSGTLLFVSHDRFFINETATRILELKERKITSYIGNYDYYENHQTFDSSVEATTSNLGFTSISLGNNIVPENQNSTNFNNRNDTNLTPIELLGNKEQYILNKAEQARLRKISNEIKRIETDIDKTEKLIASIDEQVNDIMNSTNVSILTKLSLEKEEAETKLLELLEHWESLQS